MNYGKHNIEKKQKDFTNRKIMKQKKIGIRCLQAFLILLLLTCIAVAVGGYIFLKSIIDSTPVITPEDVSPIGYTSFIVDEDGVVLEKLLEAGSNRVYTELENVPDYLIDAFVAIEDSRFYDHNGIDIIGILRAAVSNITSGSISEGASTITQQLIKNSIFTNFANEETTYEKVERKIQEIFIALELETLISKDVIMEDYLNTINLGQNTLGVESASQRYFGKSVSELTLSECAVIAGITKNPTGYNPIYYPEDNEVRRQKVLDNMLEQGLINDAEYAEAMADTEAVYERIQAYNITYTGTTSPYSYFTDSLIADVLEDLQTELDYTYAQASYKLYSGGITIVSTQDTDIQAIVDEEVNDSSNYPSSVGYNINTFALTIIREDESVENYSLGNYKTWRTTTYNTDNPLFYWNEEDIEPDIELYKETLNIQEDDIVYISLDYEIQPQTAIVIMDQYTGEVKAMSGGRGEKTSSLSYNRAEAPRQPGSTFKLVSAYAPALDLGLITLGSIIADEPVTYENSTKVVTNANGSYSGDMTVRTAILRSINTVAVKTFYELETDVMWEYLTNFGFTTLVYSENGMTDTDASTALGGLTYGATVLEMTAAYATFANDGVYNEPILYTQILDSDGTILLDNTPESHVVIQESTAALVTSALQSAIYDTGSTGGKAVFSSQTIAGKTGTTTDDKDVWFVGYTPYYTGAIWYGLDQPYNITTLGFRSTSYHALLWGSIMERVHEELPVISFDEMPSSVVEVEICKYSGLLAATDRTIYVSSMKDGQLLLESLGYDNPIYSNVITGTVTCDSYTEYFADGTQPTEICSCTESGHTIVIDQFSIPAVDTDDEDDDSADDDDSTGNDDSSSDDDSAGNDDSSSDDDSTGNDDSTDDDSTDDDDSNGVTNFFDQIFNLFTQ